MKKHNFSFKDVKSLYSHLLLRDEAVATLVAETPEWKEKEETSVELKINGIEIDPLILQRIVELHLEGFEESLKLKHDDESAEEIINQKVKDILKAKFSPMIERFATLEADLTILSDEIDTMTSNFWK